MRDVTPPAGSIVVVADLVEPAQLRLPRRRWLVLAGLVLVVPALVAVSAWYAGSPVALTVSEARVSATTPVDEPVYLGVFRPGSEFGRTLHVSGVKVAATSSAPVTITPLLCVGGAVAVTSDPAAFCEEITNPEGRTLGSDDSIVLEVSGSVPGAVSVERVRVAYRDGLRWDTQPAGSPSVVNLIAS